MPPFEHRSSSVLLAEGLRQSIVSISESETKLHSHKCSTFALCTCVMCTTYLLISPFPYSGFMAMELVEGLTHENAGRYAGVISSSFMIGRALGAYPWGKIADVYGRRFALLASLILSSVFSLAFGLSGTYRAAIVSRFFLGLSNNIMAIVKTSVSELARGDKEKETSSMGLVVTMWGWGLLVSPAISGAISEPIEQYPNFHWFNGEFDSILSSFPFILPNLIGAIFCTIALVSVFFCVEETLPSQNRRDVQLLCCDSLAWIQTASSQIWQRIKPVAVTSRRYDDTTIAASNGSRGLKSKKECIPKEEEGSTDDTRILTVESCSELSALLSSPSMASYSSALHRPSNASQTLSIEGESEHGSSDSAATETRKTAFFSLLKQKNSRDHLIAYWTFSFAQVCLDEAFPLFCMSKDGGLGFLESDIGKVLSGSGLVFVMVQYFMFAHLIDRCGLYGSMIVGVGMGTLPVVLVPVSLLLNRGGAMVTTLVFLSVVLAVCKVFCGVFYAGITIALNRTVGASHRASLNSLSALGGSAARAAGPTFAGYLLAFSISSGVFAPRIGSAFAFSVIGALGLVALFLTFVLSEDASEAAKPIRLAEKTNKMDPE